MNFVYQSEIMEKYGLNRKDCFLYTFPLFCVDVEPITVWRVFGEGQNHWEEGHVEGVHPKPIAVNHLLEPDFKAREYQIKQWSNKLWSKSFQYIVWLKVQFNPLFPGMPVGKIV